MIAYLKKFGVILLGGFLLGITLTILLGIPWRFVLSLAVFLFILNTIIEQASGYSAVTNLAKKVFAFAVGVIIFVGLRAVAGYLLDLPAGQTYEDLVSGNGLSGIPARQLTVNIVFEILFLLPGVAIAYLVVKEGKFWKAVIGLFCAVLLAWVTWSIKQKPHATAMKRQTQAGINLDARHRNNRALANETSFGIAKTDVNIFYQWDGTNITLDQTITNVVRISGQVLQFRPNDLPVVFEGQAFTQVVLANDNNSFVGGIKVWVETWKFDWVDGKSAIATPNKTLSAFTVNKGEVISTLSVPDNSTVYIEADKAFYLLEKYGNNDDGSEKLSKLTVPPGKSKKYFAWGGTMRVAGQYDNTQIKLHL